MCDEGRTDQIQQEVYKAGRKTIKEDKAQQTLISVEYLEEKQ